MKAAQINEYGDSTKIIIRDADKPVITDDQVLVEVAAASLNPFDTSVREGHVSEMMPLQFPATLGLDIAGTVVEIGANVTGFGVGDNVYGTANALLGNSGAFAEFAATDAGNIALAPKNVSDVQAASLPTAGISALQAMNSLDIQSGQNVFINGASGGVGSIAVQIAKHRGAHVAATASADNRDYVLSLGTDQFIDYKSDKFVDQLHDYDAALNNVRSDGALDVLATLKRGGKAVSLTGPFDEAKATELGITASAQMTHVNTAVLDELRALVEDGTVTVSVDKTFPLDQTAAAYDARESQSIKGKVAITIK